MHIFLQKISGLIALNDTGAAISDTQDVLLNYLSRWIYRGEKPEPLAVEFWREVVRLSERWKTLSSRVSQGVEAEDSEQLERASINYRLLELVNDFPALPALYNKLSQVVHYGFHLASYAQQFTGREVAGYLLTDYVGIGGFGTVFKAWHMHLQHEAAVKISHPIVAGEQFIEELLHACLDPLKHLKHQYIAAALDAGEVSLDEYRRMFVITEFVPGSNLRSVCLSQDKSTPEFVRDGLDIAVKVCEALIHCHSTSYVYRPGIQVTGIKHGDIKPENILLDHNNNPKLIDFMFVDLTRLYKLLVLQPEFLKSRGYGTSMFGTYGYMAPEQHSQGIVTERSDIYAFGILLFEMFGRLILDTSRPISFNSSKDVACILNNRRLPNVISQIIYKATQLDPNDRYDSMQEILKELRSGVGGDHEQNSCATKHARCGTVVSRKGMNPKIFISYRREDSAPIAGRIYDWLGAHFGRESIFMDIDSIPAGVDFRQHLQAAVANSDVLLALMGEKWVRPSQEGKSRFDDPKDFVRTEIEAALARNIPIIPVLLGNTPMPAASELPPTLKDITYRNAVPIDHGRDFYMHMDRLIRGIERSYSVFMQ